MEPEREAGESEEEWHTRLDAFYAGTQYEADVAFNRARDEASREAYSLEREAERTCWRCHRSFSMTS
jgi:hypothetical protein